MGGYVGMEKELTLGSLFDGIGGWQIAATHAGIKPIWSSEIDEFPMRVTKKWFPNTIQLGDITKLDGAEIPPVDIICAGSPCQDLSVAGKRAGLEGERSGLFRKAIDIVRGMRKSTGGVQPRFFIWENVPGAFSSNKGQDFRAVLEEIGQTYFPMPPNDKWTTAGLVECENAEIAWRVLDAQYWGVPQRRKRIFLVADFAKTARCAGKILFKSKGLSGHIKKGEAERESPSRETENSFRETGTVGALCAGDYKGVGNQYVSQGECVVEYWKDDQPQTVDTLTSRNAGGAQRMPDKDHFNGVIVHDNREPQG